MRVHGAPPPHQHFPGTCALSLASNRSVSLPAGLPLCFWRSSFSRWLGLAGNLGLFFFFLEEKKGWRAHCLGSIASNRAGHLLPQTAAAVGVVWCGSPSGRPHHLQRAGGSQSGAKGLFRHQTATVICLASACPNVRPSSQNF